MTKAEKRSQRLSSVRKLAENQEKRAALMVARARQQLNYYEEKLIELKNYYEEYRRTINKQKTNGISTAQLQEYQYFMKQLDDGIKQLTRKVSEQKRMNLSDEKTWQCARQRTDSLDKLVMKLSSMGKKIQNNRTANELDDTAQNIRMRF